MRGVVLLYGGADLPSLARYRLRDRPAWEREFAAWGLALGFGDLEPGRWIARVAPRPVLFINGVRDELVGEANARLLQEKAGAPKTVVWLDTEHMQPDAEDLLVDLVGRARQWADTLDGQPLGRDSIRAPAGRMNRLSGVATLRGFASVIAPMGSPVIPPASLHFQNCQRVGTHMPSTWTKSW